MQAQYTCVQCGAIFIRDGRRQIKSKNTHCSRRCAALTASGSMSAKPDVHSLSNIEPETRQALCKVCGPARIRPIGTTGYWSCGTRDFTIKTAWVHQLSTVDPDTRTAVCKTCGPVAIYKTTRDSKTIWFCAVGHEARISHSTRRSFLRECCERCGFVPEDICQLDINHRDGHRENENPSNLETLCANCHRLITKQQRGGWTFDGQRWLKPAAV